MTMRTTGSTGLPHLRPRLPRDTGFPQVDAENDFLRMRRRHVLAQLARWLRLLPAGSGRLLALDEVLTAPGPRAQRRLGLRPIPLDQIVGTVDSRRDFDRWFRPTSDRVRFRWERLALAQRRGVALPPIEVYCVRGQYFVLDGHHRVSVAYAAGQAVIEAYVTEIVTAVPAGCRPARDAAGASPDGTSCGAAALTAPR